MGATTKIKVLEAIYQGNIGGGESHVLDLIGELDRSGFEPVVLSFTKGQMMEKIREKGVKNYVLPSTASFDIKKWWKVRALIKNEEIDLIHVHGTKAALNLLWAAKSLRVPLIYTVHGWSFHDDQSPVKKRLRVLTEKFLTGRMDQNISVSLSNQVRGKKHFRNFESVVINNGIDLRKFNPRRNDYADIRRELNIPSEVTLVSYIARITRQKNPFVMIKAFAKTLEKSRNIRLLVVGDGELKEPVIQMAKELLLQDHVIFQPFREDIPAILKATDIYCLPSLWEGLSIGLLEAMAMGNAIIASRVDGSKEIIQHGRNGIFIDPEQPEQLANAILLLHQDQAFRQQLQHAAIQTIEGRFNTTVMTRGIESLYLNVLCKKKALGIGLAIKKVIRFSHLGMYTIKNGVNADDLFL